MKFVTIQDPEAEEQRAEDDAILGYVAMQRQNLESLERNIISAQGVLRAADRTNLSQEVRDQTQKNIDIWTEQHEAAVAGWQEAVEMARMAQMRRNVYNGLNPDGTPPENGQPAALPPEAVPVPRPLAVEPAS